MLCIAAALTEYRKLGPEKYQMAMKMILDGWDGDPDSLRAETVTGVCRFVDLYSGEFDPKRAVKRFRTVDTSKKIKTIFRNRMEHGIRCSGAVPYSYKMAEDKTLLVDDEAAAVVKRIFAMAPMERRSSRSPRL